MYKSIQNGVALCVLCISISLHGVTTSGREYYMQIILYI